MKFYMKKTILILLVSLAGALCVPNLHGQLATGDLYIRDPFIVVDAQKGQEGQTLGDGAERAHFHELKDTGHTLLVKRELK
jgi:hypothetical protein